MIDPAQDRLNRTGSNVIYALIILFAWDIVAPYFFGGVSGDANTRAVLANLLIAVCSFLFGNNLGKQQAERTAQTLSETLKKTVPDNSTATIAVGNGESVKVEGKGDGEQA